MSTIWSSALPLLRFSRMSTTLLLRGLHREASGIPRIFFVRLMQVREVVLHLVCSLETNATNLELKARTIGEENFQLSSAIDLVPIQISPVINVFQQSFSCPAGTGSVLLQATVTLDFDVTYHITTSGELALDDFNQFIITAGRATFHSCEFDIKKSFIAISC